MKGFIQCLTLLIISSFLTISLFAQSITLDTKRGFKNFVIGDIKSKFEGSFEYLKTTSEGNIGYIYKPKKLVENYVFDNEFNLIILFFDKSEKLAVINLVKNYDKDSYSKATDELKEIINNLNRVFGQFSKKYQDDKDNRIGVAWAGNEILLICTNKYLGYNTGSQTEIMISKYDKSDSVGF